jgi:phage gpG-like protein
VSVAGLEIKYSVGDQDDDLALQRMMVAFERLDAEFSDFGNAVFPKLVPLFETETRRQFDDEGSGPNRGNFEALSDDYANWKNRYHPGKPILELSGQMRDALTESSSPFALRTYDAHDFDFGTKSVPYASFHQTGTSRMPSRPPFDFSGNFERDLLRVGAEAMREAVKKSGAGEFGEFRE